MQVMDTLRQLIDERQGRLAEGIPPDHEAALLALLRHIDRIEDDPAEPPALDVITGRALPALGAMLALRLVIERHSEQPAPSRHADEWAVGFLAECRDVESAAIVLRLAEAGTMRLDAPGDGHFDAWLIGGRAPAMWRERAGINDWARRMARSVRRGAVGMATAEASVARVAHQLPYPADADLGGVPAATYLAVLAGLIDLRAGSRLPSVPEGFDAHELAGAVARARNLDTMLVGKALSAMTLDRSNVSWHGDTLAGPLPPLVRLESGRVAWTRRGMETEPLFFVARELRRRDPSAYHSASRLRETVFRSDLAGLFSGSRYVHSLAPIMLRTRDRQNRTDIDAAVFDRKTGTLAVFELKSQDPFARSAAERARQMESLRLAGAQMAAVLAWIDREGPDEVLSRMERETARRFRVHRVLPFVLGRYLAEDGEATRRDARVAWGTWPDVVRLVDASTGGSPLSSLHAALGKSPGTSLEAWSELPPARIRLGDADLHVHASSGSARNARMDRI